MTQIRLRQDTATNWSSSSSITPALGEPCIQTDGEKYFKIGDGTNKFNNLPYFVRSTELGDLDDLTTENKDTFVGAINEIVDNGGNKDLSNLTTTGENKLQAVKAYTSNGEMLQDADGLSFIKNYAHSTFDRSKFTVVGSPNITDDGILTNNFNNNSNYVSVPFSYTGNWRVEFPWKSPSNFGSSQFVLTSWSSSFIRIIINPSGVIGFTIYLSDTTSVTKNINFSFSPNTDYVIFIAKTSTGYTFGIKEASANSYTEDSITSNLETNGNPLIFFANSDISDKGSIDLKQFSITVDGVEVFSGNKTGIDTIKPDAYTTTTTPPTISNDGIASNFTSSNFIKVPKEILNNVRTNSWSIEVEGVCNNYGAFAPVFSGSGHVWNDTSAFFNIGRLSTANTWISYIILDNNGTKENTLIGASGTLQASIAGQAYKLILGYDSVTKKYYSNTEFADGTKVEKEVQSNLYLAQQTDDLYIGYNYGDYKLDLNTLKIYVAGDLKYQGCLKIPYTESKTGSKIVDAIYRDRVNDMAEQFGYANYYTLQDEPKGDYMIVGTPTISSDFVASGFSTSNYLTKKITDLDYSKDFDFISPVATLASNSSQKFIVLDGGTGGGGFRISQHVAQVKFSFKLNSSTTLTDYTILSDLVVGDKIQGRVKKVGTNLYLYARKNGGEWVGYANNPITNVTTLNATNIICIGWAGAGDAYCWDGSVDLNPYRVFVDNTLLYEAVIEPNFTLPQVELYGLIGQRTLRDSYRNGINYWELYSNRDLEQGGSCTSGVEVTFTRPFADTNYVLSVPYSAKSVTSFTPTQTGDWIAKGKGVL